MGRDVNGVPSDIAEVATAYGAQPGVVAVVMGGSRTTGVANEDSDIDLYVYAPEPPPLPHRAAVAAQFATVREVGNTCWEDGDEWIDARTGRHVDVIYRSPGWIEDQLVRVLVRHEASIGYSTSLWHNVLHSRPMVDPEAWYGRLQDRARQPYPAPLKRAVVAKNHPILRGTLSSYLHQIQLAVARGDAVSVQHRVSALLASYFDILFAVNERPHPGEKRLLQLALEQCSRLPPSCQAALDDLLVLPSAPPTDSVVSRVNTLVDGLDAWLQSEGLLISAAMGAAGQHDSLRKSS
jgi:Nucleotidyltransferase domain